MSEGEEKGRRGGLMYIRIEWTCRWRGDSTQSTRCSTTQTICHNDLGWRERGCVMPWGLRCVVVRIRLEEVRARMRVSWLELSANDKEGTDWRDPAKKLLAL